MNFIISITKQYKNGKQLLFGQKRGKEKEKPWAWYLLGGNKLSIRQVEGIALSIKLNCWIWEEIHCRFVAKHWYQKHKIILCRLRRS